MKAELLVCDHDGTFTDAEKEFDTYKEVYLHALSKKLGSISVYDLDQYFSSAEHAAQTEPHLYTWKIDNTIIAPGTADHVLFVRTCAHIALEQLSRQDTSRSIPPVDTWSTLLNELYWESYPKAGTFYKDGAREILLDLHRTGRFTFITNSDTIAVRKKLHTVLQGTWADASDISVIGNAKKWAVDVSWDGIDVSMQPDFFPHAVQLRRKTYAMTLQSLGIPIGIVAGDIYEMDLAMPSQLGIYTVLLTSKFTTPWEYQYYEQYPNGRRAATLFELRSAIDHHM